MNHDANGKDTGAAYVYKKRNARWYFTSKISAHQQASEDRFGWNVALSDGTAVIAVPNLDTKGPDLGSVFIQEL